ncbi:1-deoxy-D-xylulose-5-phosphate reductoisomerase [Marinicella sediminis]|uniref:1-deoxy-D-xylulose 5-phosphate reductoisomerase n=1 Tax=Marinicella sediminis TaxID=1792834 RepID=A0ABV7JBV1_9GAMM|nr:1-deoxy-D-xylulose-5-phosphate reductoisomerase [Marinicella sediminis]
MKQLAVLGATGSIGDSTLAIIRKHPEKFKVFALSGHNNATKLIRLALEFRPAVVCVTSESAYPEVQQGLTASGIEVTMGHEALNQLVNESVVDMVVAGIVGNAGMSSVMAAVDAGKTLLLANKESIVSAGELVMPRAREKGARIIPLDSEHNAIYQCLGTSYQVGERPVGVASITLTASGGPFWEKPLAEFASITPEQAVAHPRWDMGAKISVDSATLMNKGLEVIEAHWLFNMPETEIGVMVHPQSIIHSMVNYLDGSVLAQLGDPDMQIPISFGLGLGQRITNNASFLDLLSVGQLQFTAADDHKFPCLDLARQAIRHGGTAAAILNAANEVTVKAFLNHQIGFLQIPEMNDKILNSLPIEAVESMAQLSELDRRVRVLTQQLIKQAN